MFLHKTKVHGYKSPIIVHFKGNTCPRCKSVFSSEKSANDHYRRNLKRKTCAKPRGTEASHVPSRRPAPSPPKNRGKRAGKRLGTQQTLFGVFGFAAQRDRGEKRSLAHSGRGTNSRGGRGAGSKSLPKPKSGKGQTPSNGSAKSDISSWFAKRAFSNQSGQGGPATTSHHREAGQASCNREQASSIATPDQDFFRRSAACKMVHTTPRKLKSTCSALRFTRGARCTRSGISFTQLMCTGAQLQDGPPPHW